jgi:c-di-GMP phosphodiesterase
LPVTGRRRKLLVMALIVLLGLLPTPALLTLSYLQDVQQMDAELERYASNLLDRSDEIFSTAETTLDRMAQNLEPRCSEPTLQSLRRIVFESIYFQEATLVSGSAVQCSSTSAGPPQPINYAENLIVPKTGIHISAPVLVRREETVTIVIHRRVTDQVMFGLHLNPVLLGEPERKYASADSVTLALERSDGVLLTQVGYGSIPVSQLGGRRVTLQSKTYPIRAIAVAPIGGVLNSWRRNALLFAAIGLLISASLLMVLRYAARHQFSASADVRDALADGQFQVYYQPVLDTATGACVGGESLLRWHHPQLGVLLPDTFIPAAEESGFIVELTRWLMARLVTDMGQLLREHPDFHISLNVSPGHLNDPRVLHDIEEILGKHIPLQQIVFEITEHQLIVDDDDRVLHVLQKIRALGTPIAIDDFGSGYSSLKYLSRFPFDYLKIDKAFVDAIGTESVTAGLVDTIVQMANKLKLKTIAEGVERAVQLQHLRALKVDFLQGWMFSKAVPADQFRAFVASNQALARHKAGT